MASTSCSSPSPPAASTSSPSTSATSPPTASRPLRRSPRRLHARADPTADRLILEARILTTRRHRARPIPREPSPPPKSHSRSLETSLKDRADEGVAPAETVDRASRSKTTSNAPESGDPPKHPSNASEPPAPPSHPSINPGAKTTSSKTSPPPKPSAAHHTPVSREVDAASAHATEDQRDLRSPPSRSHRRRKLPPFPSTLRFTIHAGTQRTDPDLPPLLLQHRPVPVVRIPNVIDSRRQPLHPRLSTSTHHPPPRRRLRSLTVRFPPDGLEVFYVRGGYENELPPHHRRTLGQARIHRRRRHLRRNIPQLPSRRPLLIPRSLCR